MNNLAPEKKFYLNHHKSEQVNRGGKHNFNSEIKEIYNFSFANGGRYHIMEEVLDKTKEYKLVVEVGCGECSMLKYYSENYNFKEIIGYDIAFSNETFEQNTYKNVTLLEGNFNHDYPLQNNSVDCIVMMMVIEHLFDPFHSFSEIHRVLKKDGLAFVNLPLVTSIKNRLRLLFGNVPVTSVAYKQWWIVNEWDGNHLHSFSINSIKRLCDKFDLEIVKISPVGKLVFLKKIFKSLFCDEISFCIKKKNA
jgi:ubiquinone/menaquinone biosynthesis C-methylase UbiE